MTCKNHCIPGDYCGEALDGDDILLCETCPDSTFPLVNGKHDVRRCYAALLRVHDGALSVAMLLRKRFPDAHFEGFVDNGPAGRQVVFGYRGNQVAMNDGAMLPDNGNYEVIAQSIANDFIRFEVEPHTRLANGTAPELPVPHRLASN